MVKNYFILLLVVISAAFTTVNAQDAPVLTFSPPAQNNVMYNRFLLNPTFSFVREDNTYVSLYHRNQWVQFDDSPKVYMLSYSGRFTDRAGFGFGVYQQTLGVITSIGGIANYAYTVKIRNKFDLTLGFNVAYYSSGVDKNRTITEEPDPVIMAMRNNSLVSIKPGINVGYKNFDFGLYAENFIDYDFKSADMARDFTDKTLSGHIMYTHKLNNSKDIFTDGDLRFMVRGRSSEQTGFGLNGSLVVNFPRIGWLQTGLDNYYGVAIGTGFHFTKRLSLGYTYERTTKEGLVNLGPTHEITMVLSFKDRESAAAKEYPGTPKDTLAAMDKKLAEEIAQSKDSVTVKGSASVPKTEVGSVKQLDTVSNGNKKGAEVVNETTTNIKSGLPSGAERYKTPGTSEVKSNQGFDRKAEIEKLKMGMDSDSQHLLDELLDSEDPDETREEFDEKIKNLKEYAEREKRAKANAGEYKPVELKLIREGKVIKNPKTLEELKSAPEGYYVISKDAKAKEGDKRVRITREKSFTDAANTARKKKESGKEKGVYIVHVLDAPEPEEVVVSGPEVTTGEIQPTISDEQTPQSPVSENPKTDNLKTEAQIKEFYADRTAKPRETLNKVNRLTVQGMEPGYYIIASVFSSRENAENFITMMKDRGLKTGLFLNPKNKFIYVYLKKHTSWREALISYYSNVDNTYFDPIWIMSINTN